MDQRKPDDGPTESEPFVVDLDDPRGTTGEPEAIVEQPDLWLEREPWAKWAGVAGELHLTTLLVARRAKRLRGEYVPTLPWLAVAVTGAIAVAALAVVAVLLTLTD